jgi:N utilization substance protein A
VEEIANADLSELFSIEGFDESLAAEIHNRAVLWASKKIAAIRELCVQNGVSQELIDYKLLSPELLELLVRSNIKTINDLGDLASDELLEIAGDLLSKMEAEALIMEIRKGWFA